MGDQTSRSNVIAGFTPFTKFFIHHLNILSKPLFLDSLDKSHQRQRLVSCDHTCPALSFMFISFAYSPSIELISLK